MGYTNAGKSTLFNRLTDFEVTAKDQLFATLDPTMRAIELPGTQKAILSDTVGFVSSLPHELVNAFHATLEEVAEADLIVHVRDVAHADTDQQKADVLGVLTDMGIGEAAQEEMIEVLNKIDLLDEAQKRTVTARAARSNLSTVAVSAETGEGCQPLREAIGERLSAGFQTLDLRVDAADGRKLAWLYQHGDVVEREDLDDSIRLKVRLSPAEAARYQHQSH